MELLLRRNGTANNKGYLLGAMLGSTNSNNACAVPRKTKCEHATPLVPLEQSAISAVRRLVIDLPTQNTTPMKNEEYQEIERNS